MEYVSNSIVATEAEFEKNDVDYESLGIEKAYEPCPFRFNIDDISTYNPANDNKTTLRFKNGDSFRINMTFEEFDSQLITLLKSRNK